MKALSSWPSLRPALGLGVSLVTLHGLADEETKALRGEVTFHRSQVTDGIVLILISK